AAVPVAARPAVAVPKAAPAAAVPVARPMAAKPVAVPVSAKPAVADELEGKTLGTYKIVRKLGDGKWGSVYEAVQISMGRSVAMKILAPHLQEQPDAKK